MIMKTKVLVIGSVMLFLPFLVLRVCGQEEYLSPTRMAVHPVTKEVFVLLSTARAVAKVNPVTEHVQGNVPLGFTPSDICFSPDGNTMYITEYAAAGRIHAFSAADGKKRWSVEAGSYSAALCTNRSGTRAWVANRFSNDVSVIDLSKRKEIKRIALIREPKSLALSPDEKIVAVGNFLPLQPVPNNEVAAQVSLIDAEQDTVVTHISLSDGTHSIADVCFSGQGQVLFVTHILSHYTFPTTQLERGWMNTNALSLIDVSQRVYSGTVLLDDMYCGAANPCGMALSDDGNRLAVVLSGTHELMVLSLPPLLEMMKQGKTKTLVNDLNFLTGHKTRIPLCGKGARHVINLDRKWLTGDYFSGGLSVVEADAPANRRFIKLGEEPEADAIRKGELFFSDARLCFQHWQSCLSCHPDARADGLNWDLLNDGIGNPKNTKSLLYAHVTPPCMITGIRPNAETAVRAGVRHIQFALISEDDAACIDRYLRSLRSIPSPYLEKGKLTKVARQGKKLFAQAGCADCHNGTYHTDGRSYDVGTGIEEYTNIPFDTPSLKEVWRTAPYLYNGSARTIREVLTIFNREDRHGVTKHLSEEEIKALEAYVLSL
jgi:YVTN family beta-propeller protein